MKFDKNFFLNQGDELVFSDRNDFDAKYKILDLEVPRRTKGRKNVHRERYTFFNYLRILNSNLRLNFPLKAIKSERPDFYLENDRKIGIEVTEATDQNYQRASTQLEKLSEKVVLHQRLPLIGISAYKPWNNRRDPYRGISEHGQVPKGDSWVGNEVEKIWSHYIIRCMKAKLTDLNDQNKQYGFAEKYVLLIQDETPTADLIIGDALQMLTPEINRLRKEFALFFNEISVFRSHYLIYDINRRGEVLYGTY